MNSRISDFRFRISDFPRRRVGFTLVELMVSVALAIIIMTLFATIYSWSTETYSTQKGIRRNDQRSRMLVTVIKGDLNNRTFKDLVPFWPGQDSTADVPPRFTRDDRRGYFTISENDPDDDTDDVLGLTIRTPTDNSQRWYTARAKALATPLTGTPNQPETDDGQFTANDAGASTAAEVVYFLRNGNLYRRVLLIREPYDGTDPQPTGVTGNYDPATFQAGTRTGIFWNDFAYSAYYRTAAGATGVRFNGIASLQNNSSTGATIDGFPPELGIPPLRFGYSLSRPFAPNQEQLLPREVVSQYRDANGTVVATSAFIGRFLDQETGDPNFLYPGSISSGDPHTRTPLTLNRNPSDNRFGTVEEYSTITPPAHRGEDILMTNVHSFDVKVWDGAYNEDANANGVLDTGEDHNGNGKLDTSGGFVDLGHTNPTGFYRRAFNNRSLSNNQWNRFDTWHPFPGIGATPPYKATGAGTGQATSLSAPALGSNDERPLLAIQITIRFYDETTKQMRQLTIQHSLKK